MEAKLIVGGSLMHADQQPDFSGWATKAGIKCSDGRTILPGAFKHQDKATVPLVWQHNHSEPTNVLGHAVLEHRDEGVYCYGYFNDTTQADNAKKLVSHNDIKYLSIFANQLMEKASSVMHGIIREVSLVLAGANPGALIDNIAIQHGDDTPVIIDDEAVIYTGLELSHADSDGDGGTSGSGNDVPGDATDKTINDIYNSMSEEQKTVVHTMVGAALEAEAPNDTNSAEHSGAASGDSNNTKEGTHMTRNVFEQNAGTASAGTAAPKHELSHADVQGIVQDAIKGGSLKEAVEKYALKHGIENLDILFPDFKNITDTPEFNSRRMEWVAGVLAGTRKSPFSRVRSFVADITMESARALGYIKGSMKKEEFFSVSRRTTTPTTVYKKQKLDRDDIIDITDFDVVMWMKGEMRIMLEEELARAILIGDGRAVDDEDKIRDPMGAPEGAGIRSILHDHELYVAQLTVPTNTAPADMVDTVIENMRYYKGSGTPTLYTTLPRMTNMLLAKDTLGRRLYANKTDLASALGVANIVPVEVMETIPDLVGIIVNLTDYNVGADRGGEVNLFDFFDIDFNQYKYLIETRISGALIKIRSALVLRVAAAGDVEVALVPPTQTGHVINGLDQANVTYVVTDSNNDVVPVVNGSATIASEDVAPVTVSATPAAGHYFDNSVDANWTFEY